MMIQIKLGSRGNEMKGVLPGTSLALRTALKGLFAVSNDVLKWERLVLYKNSVVIIGTMLGVPDRASIRMAFSIKASQMSRPKLRVVEGGAGRSDKQ